MTHLTETIKRFRDEECACTAERICEIAKMDPPHFRRICAGKRVPKLVTLWKLAQALSECSKPDRDRKLSTKDVFRILLDALARDIQDAVAAEKLSD